MSLLETIKEIDPSSDLKLSDLNKTYLKDFQDVLPIIEKDSYLDHLIKLVNASNYLNEQDQYDKYLKRLMNEIIENAPSLDKPISGDQSVNEYIYSKLPKDIQNELEQKLLKHRANMSNLITNETVVNVIIANNLDKLKYIVSTGKQMNSYLIVRAAEYNRLEILKYLLPITGTTCINMAINVAKIQNYIDIFEYLINYSRLIRL